MPRYGWVRDLPDQRDRKYARPFCAYAASPRPSSVDLRPQCAPVYDQGDLGSCTGNAIAAAMQFERRKQGLADFLPSRLMIYFLERRSENTVPYDNGAQIRDGIKAVAQYGVCPESEWAYDPSQFAVCPPQSCFDEAAKDKAVSYLSVNQDVADLTECLAEGYPFVFGFTVYQSFESAAVAQSGVAKLPGWFERPVGGHAVMAVGYDDDAQTFLVRNSWGGQWGQGGYFTLPYAYLGNGNLASDFWTIRLVESAVSGAAA